MATGGAPRTAGRGTEVLVEVLRLAIVGVTTALGWTIGPAFADLFNAADAEEARFTTSLLGALLGYVLGGLVGRGIVRGVDAAERRLAEVEASVLIAGTFGGVIGATLSFALFWPVVLLPRRSVTIPIALLISIAMVIAGVRLGSTRGGDLARYVGVRGRLNVRTPSRGEGIKVVDTSSLIDSRMLEVARSGFVEGTLVVPLFVVYELQGLADAEDPSRRSRGRRGLDVLQALQDDGIVAVEIADDEVPLVQEVDAKLVELCRRRSAALLTVDANLARVAEVTGVRVLSLHRLSQALRPIVQPGDEVEVAIVKEGREDRQGVGYLEDGTMVVVERAAEDLGKAISVSITSVTQNRNGRMLFAVRSQEATPANEPDGGRGEDNVRSLRRGE